MGRKKKTPDEKVRDRFFSIVNSERKKNGISLDDLACLCGTTSRTISNMQKGRSPLRIDIMCNISIALKFDSEDIKYICDPMEFKPLNLSLKR